ncbi:MAG: prepilin-type N-terminal cleavage/methylation domain-containing protein [Acidobacteriota bacterium]
MLRKKNKGFTLIELLIVVAIIGIIAAIAIPNLLNAINRGRQKRTMADMRSIATACDEYNIDNNRYVNLNAGGFADVTTLKNYLEPHYIRIIPEKDGWATYMQHAGGDTDAYTDYTLCSYGKDTTADGPVTPPQTTDFDADIYFIDGQFTQWPEGMQT